MANNPNAAKNLKPAKKGEIRNPKGKPKGTLNSKTILKRFMAIEEKVRNPMTGTDEKLTLAETLYLVQLAKARKGDLSSFKEVMDRWEGRAQQSIDHTTDGKPLPTPLTANVIPIDPYKEVQDGISNNNSAQETLIPEEKD